MWTSCDLIRTETNKYNSLSTILNSVIGLRNGMLCIFLCFSLISNSLLAQDRCSITKYEELLNRKFPNRESRDSFEKWMSGNLRQQQTANATSGNYIIPVVVHIIHNGEAVGTGTNLSEAQIQSQIQVLNNDFRRLNADAVKTPSDFTGVAGAFGVEFVLARRTLPLVESVRIYSIKHRVNKNTTAARIEELTKKNVFTNDEADFFQNAHRFLTYILLKDQVASVKEGKPIKSFIDPKKLLEREKDLLKMYLKKINELKIRARGDISEEYF